MSSITRNSLVLTVAAAATLFAFSSRAHAADPAPQITVNYSDLNLSDAADAQRLYRRLRAAASVACNQYDGRDLYKVTLKRQCTSAALQRAVMDVNDAAIFALHEKQDDVKVAEKTGTSSPRG